MFFLFTFAMACQVPMLMEKLDQGPLRKFTPCLFRKRNEIIHAVAVVHALLVKAMGGWPGIIAVLMGLQAGLPPFDFERLKGKTRQKYFAAVRAGMEYNYAPMEAVFRGV